jgi:HEPN/RES N-terminal domain 1/RES domain
MGLAKARQMDEWDQGWSFTSQYVCAGCVDDTVLKAALGAAAGAEEVCDFCGARPAAKLDVLLEHFVRGLRNEYGDADDEGVFYDGDDGGYQWGRTWDTPDLVETFGHVLTGAGLVEAVSAAMHNRTWVEVVFAGPRRDEALTASWDRFCHAVMYETRYVFWLRGDGGEQHELGVGEIPAARILQELGDLIVTLDLARDLPAGHELWRARPHAEPGVAYGGRDLGTAPREHARQANRMSPAGIRMFYGAVDAETAIKETAAHTDFAWITVGAFHTSQLCTVVDFTHLPVVPSIFDVERGGLHRPLLFLHQFVAQLSKPIRGRDYEQIDYVPTQVVTEYLLRIFGNGRAVCGILYPSALTGAACVVLDVPNERCVDTGMSLPGDKLGLWLMPGSVRSGTCQEF